MRISNRSSQNVVVICALGISCHVTHHSCHIRQKYLCIWLNFPILHQYAHNKSFLTYSSSNSCSDVDLCTLTGGLMPELFLWLTDSSETVSDTLADRAFCTSPGVKVVVEGMSRLSRVIPPVTSPTVLLHREKLTTSTSEQQSFSFYRISHIFYRFLWEQNCGNGDRQKASWQTYYDQKAVWWNLHADYRHKYRYRKYDSM